MMESEVFCWRCTTNTETINTTAEFGHIRQLGEWEGASEQASELAIVCDGCALCQANANDHVPEMMSNEHTREIFVVVVVGNTIFHLLAIEIACETIYGVSSNCYVQAALSNQQCGDGGGALVLTRARYRMKRTNGRGLAHITGGRRPLDDFETIKKTKGRKRFDSSQTIRQ